MPRVLSAALALVLFTASSYAQSNGVPASPALPAGHEFMSSALARLDRSEYAEAISAFDKALDSYATAQRLDEFRQTYMRMFVGNRFHANVLMKAMKAWVEKRRTEPAGLAPSTVAEFGVWVQERDALAAATVNLAHNSPDWK